MAKLDNTHQTIENIVGARVEEINGEIFLYNEEAFEEPINVLNMFKLYVGQAVDFKLAGSTPVTNAIFKE